jgi:alpha-glucosidase
MNRIFDMEKLKKGGIMPHCTILKFDRVLIEKKMQSFTSLCRYCLVAFFSLFVVAHCYGSVTDIIATSPDQKTKIEFATVKGQLQYRVVYNGHTVINWSRLGLQTNELQLANEIAIDGKTLHNHREQFKWPLGEDAVIDNNYQQIDLQCHSANVKFLVIARVFDGSVAIRYAVQKLEQPVHVTKELTEFNLTNDYRIYQYHEESVFRPTPVDSLYGIGDLPSTLASPKLYLSIGEAENRNYSKCVLVKGAKPHGLALNFYTDTVYRKGKAPAISRDSVLTFKDSLITPWRTICMSPTAVGLHRFSELSLKLTAPTDDQKAFLVRPGKVFRVQISTESGLHGVDLASRMNFQYIMYDAGWYGAEFRTTSDPTHTIPELDLPRVIAYAHSKHIGVILYVNYVGLRAKLDTILPLYKKWGVDGLKFGFVDGGTQKGLTWLDSAMQKVNDYGLVLNVHDHYKPTGLSRRYPYNISQEGIRGDENSPDAFHTMVLPYTRFLAGAADFTFCYPNKKNSFSKNLKVSKGQQLALTVIFFDPLQSIFWYGKPEDYEDGQDIEFLKYVPTVWDESHYLQGQIGENISVARRKGDTWFIGSATGYKPWETKLNLNFLMPGKEYEATIYEDDGSGNIKVSKKILKRGQTVKVNLAEKCGQAMIVRLMK